MPKRKEDKSEKRTKFSRISSIVSSFPPLLTSRSHVHMLEMESRGNYYSFGRHNRVRSKGEVKTESVSARERERGETSRPRVCSPRFCKQDALQGFQIRMCTQRCVKLRHYRKCTQITITKYPIRSARECLPSHVKVRNETRTNIM